MLRWLVQDLLLFERSGDVIGEDGGDLGVGFETGDRRIGDQDDAVGKSDSVAEAVGFDDLETEVNAAGISDGQRLLVGRDQALTDAVDAGLESVVVVSGQAADVDAAKGLAETALGVALVDL